MAILCDNVWFPGCHANKGKKQLVSRFAGVANNGEEGGGKASDGCGGFPGTAHRQQRLRIQGPQSLACRAFSRLSQGGQVALGTLAPALLFQLCICYFRDKQVSPSTIRRQQLNSCG